MTVCVRGNEQHTDLMSDNATARAACALVLRGRQSAFRCVLGAAKGRVNEATTRKRIILLEIEQLDLPCTRSNETRHGRKCRFLHFLLPRGSPSPYPTRCSRCRPSCVYNLLRAVYPESSGESLPSLHTRTCINKKETATTPLQCGTEKTDKTDSSRTQGSSKGSPSGVSVAESDIDSCEYFNAGNSMPGCGRCVLPQLENSAYSTSLPAGEVCTTFVAPGKQIASRSTHNFVCMSEEYTQRLKCRHQQLEPQIRDKPFEEMYSFASLHLHARMVHGTTALPKPIAVTQ